MHTEQSQFLRVVERDEAERLWHAALWLRRLEPENVPLTGALGRVLAGDVRSPVDVPSFDRSNVDGYALRAADTFGSAEESPRELVLAPEVLVPGRVPESVVVPGLAVSVATGAMLPRGADAVVMIEYTILSKNNHILVRRPVAPGDGVTFAGTDLARGELALAEGTRLTSRETGVLAAIGRGAVPVVRRPIVAVLSTGDELLSPGSAALTAGVFDSNQTILSDAARELGAEVKLLGIVPDDEKALDRALESALVGSDLVLLSGGTSKGNGDLCHRVLARREPGIVVHGVALKPGKPICLGAVGRTPVVILPGFPTSAIFTFHEFVAPLIRQMAGAHAEPLEQTRATLPARFNSERGRTEYALVSLLAGSGGLAAYPMGKGSGSVTAFSGAEGFVTIPSQQEYLEAGECVSVTLLGRGRQPADLVVIGSHCTGLDFVLNALRRCGLTCKTLWVGSQGGLLAAGRGECDLAGVHLLDPQTGIYNVGYLPPGVRLVRGYGRMQGVVTRGDDARFPECQSAREAVRLALADPSCVMVNRNKGSGTRVLIDELLGDERPAGHAIEARSHSAVAASVAQGRCDWGLAIAPVAAAYGLKFFPLRVEQYDFAVPVARWDLPAVVEFRAVLRGEDVRGGLRELGFEPGDETGHPTRS